MLLPQGSMYPSSIYFALKAVPIWVRTLGPKPAFTFGYMDHKTLMNPFPSRAEQPTFVHDQFDYPYTLNSAHPKTAKLQGPKTRYGVVLQTRPPF